MEGTEAMSEMPRYSIVIEWSPEDSAYVVILPEWSERYAMPVADGATPQEALERAVNTLENYIQFAREDGIPLPEPRVFPTVASA